MSKIKCLVCKSTNYSKYHYFRDQDPPFMVYQCYDCLCLFQNTNQLNYKKLYSQHYYEQSQAYKYFDERKYFKACNYVYKARLKNILKFQKSGRLLDVGCSFGGFVKSANVHFDSYGLDISSYVVKEANKWINEDQNHNQTRIFQGDLNNLPKNNNLKKNSYNVISLTEVAEHLLKPIENFQTTFNLLKKNGLLIIQTANFEAWQAENKGKDYHYFLPGHTVYYRATALKQLLLSIGFTSFKEYFPTDFACIYKILKSRYFFNNIYEYKTWLNIILYHYKSKLTYKNKPLTSSYVLYAFK